MSENDLRVKLERLATSWDTMAEVLAPAGKLYSAHNEHFLMASTIRMRAAELRALLSHPREQEDKDDV